MYWAVNKNGKVMFPDFSGNYTDKELQRRFYTLEDDINEQAKTIKDVKQLFEDLKTEEANGGFEVGEYTQYKTVYDFIRSELECVTPLVPVSESEKALNKLMKVFKLHGIDEPQDEKSNVIEWLRTEYSGQLPNWLECSGRYYGLNELLEYFWDTDIGFYQSLYC